MSRKRNKGLDRRGRLMMLMWMSIWLCGSLWSGLHGGNDVLTAMWHGFLVMAGCMGVYLLGGCLCSVPELWRQEQERIERDGTECERRLRKEIRKLDRKAYRRQCLEREEHNSDNPGFIPMS